MIGGFKLRAAYLGAVTVVALLACSIVKGQDELPRSTSDSNVGYIDRAQVGNIFRLRFDAAFNNIRPDAAEFFYAKCGCLRVAGLDPNAPGPNPGANPLPETSVDYQVIQADLEYVVGDGLSLFFEAPIRFLNPEQNDNTAGLSDLQAGFKYELWDCEHRDVTFQLRTYIPTGDADRGLGTAHVSLEPAILWYERISDRLTLEAEFRDWIPIDGSSGAGTSSPNERFAGNVIRYGVGLGYNLIDECDFRVTPVAEFVGWTILDGLTTLGNGTAPQIDGDTIVNFKIGTRVSLASGDSLYAGYGTSLTSDTWYDDVLRVEYRRAF